MLNASLADYLVPTATDFPQVRAVTLEMRPSPSNPLGVRAAAKAAGVATAATIGNAVAATHGMERPTDGIAAFAAAVMATDRAGAQRRRGRGRKQ
jgi:hypothetical protein